MNRVETLRALMSHAADIANREAAFQELEVKGVLFKEAVGRARGKQGLCLDLTLTPEQLTPELAQTLNTIGVNAIRQSIKERSDLFGALIISDARIGRNYFDELST